MTDTGNMDSPAGDPARYFGRQVRKARLAAGLSLAEFGQQAGYDRGQISRIERGKRPPTELFAEMCDRVFPERDGWFSDFYGESRTWLATPPFFRDWLPHERKARVLRDWQPATVPGLVQTEDYARAILSVSPGVTEDQVAERLAARMDRQRILARDEPPLFLALIDESVLRRCVGSCAVMHTQLRHLAAVAAWPHVTVQVVPPIAHAGLLGSLILADDTAAIIETPVGGQVYEDPETLTVLAARLDSIRSEAYRASESRDLIGQMAEHDHSTEHMAEVVILRRQRR